MRKSTDDGIVLEENDFHPDNFQQTLNCIIDAKEVYTDIDIPEPFRQFLRSNGKEVDLSMKYAAYPAKLTFSPVEE